MAKRPAAKKAARRPAARHGPGPSSERSDGRQEVGEESRARDADPAQAPAPAGSGGAHGRPLRAR